MGLPRFGFVTVHGEPLADGPAAEGEWAERTAATGRAAAHLWRGTPGLIVPRNCTTLPGWAQAARRHAVQVRSSGGGVVPQGPGVLNLSLTWGMDASAPVQTDAVYAGLCAELAAALARLAIVALPQAVEGSFCDGRYNLAVAGRKLAGTAQSWRRIAGRMVVLAHAVIVADADPAALTDAANAFERDLGSGRHYRADALTSVALAWRDANRQPAPPDHGARLVEVLAEQFARLVPAHEVSD
jgi:lipoate-protein ligase A